MSLEFHERIEIGMRTGVTGSAVALKRRESFVSDQLTIANSSSASVYLQLLISVVRPTSSSVSHGTRALVQEILFETKTLKVER